MRTFTAGATHHAACTPHHAYRTTQPRPSHRLQTEGHGMAQKIEIRPLDKKETTGDSNSQGA
ncbi:hypothetical protein [Streptomyces sp. NPDC005930]|uniref:hypothetical protein n=1 Tax=Streptomyces sp. NPDC005930 TaxID=3364736 RepID=UPI0036C6273F